MALAPIDTYCAGAGDQFQVRRWVLRAIVLSLLLHAGLIAVFQFMKLENFRAEASAPILPAMTLWHVVDLPDTADVDGKLIPIAEPAVVAQIPMPVEEPADKIMTVPVPLAKIDIPGENGVPAAGVGGIHTGAGLDAQTAIESELRNAADALLARGTRVERDLATHGALEPKDVPGDGGDAAGLPARQTLDEIVTQTGVLHAQGALIDVSGGALFEYNSSELRPQAVEELHKLSEVIRRNPDATLSIEGHTDAIGTAEFNQALSEKRAESVKLWLVMEMGVDPERIQTRGFGSSKLRVPADRTIEEQQPNRRVEIIIKTKR